MYILHGFSISGAKIMRYFDATKYFSVKMTRQAKILIIPSYLSIKGEELSAISLVKEGISHEDAIDHICFDTVRTLPYMPETRPVIIDDT